MELEGKTLYEKLIHIIIYIVFFIVINFIRVVDFIIFRWQKDGS